MSVIKVKLVMIANRINKGIFSTSNPKPMIKIQLAMSALIIPTQHRTPTLLKIHFIPRVGVVARSRNGDTIDNKTPPTSNPCDNKQGAKPVLEFGISSDFS